MCDPKSVGGLPTAHQAWVVLWDSMTFSGTVKDELKFSGGRNVSLNICIKFEMSLKNNTQSFEMRPKCALVHIFRVM